MPNWVYNAVSITGEEKALKAFTDKAAQINGDIQTEDDSLLSFWNFIKPSAEEMPYYTGEKKDEKPENWDELNTSAQVFWDMQNARDAYHWNVRNWGTKWNACNVYAAINNEIVNYQFETAWGQPQEVFIAMTQQHPELIFEFSWEEEQGWGGEATGTNGIFEITNEYDIPASHADYVARGRECYCLSETDKDYWFTDCTGKKGNE